MSLEGVCGCIQLTLQLGQLLGQLALQHTSLLLHPSMHNMGLAQPHSPWGEGQGEGERGGEGERCGEEWRGRTGGARTHWQVLKRSQWLRLTRHTPSTVVEYRYLLLSAGSSCRGGGGWGSTDQRPQTTQARSQSLPRYTHTQTHTHTHTHTQAYTQQRTAQLLGGFYLTRTTNNKHTLNKYT